MTDSSNADPSVVENGPGERAAHIAYLSKFLAKGFHAINQLQSLTQEVGSDGGYNKPSLDPDAAMSPQRVLPGFGPKTAAGLLAACVAEPTLVSAIYWIVCTFALLREPLPDGLDTQVVELVLKCRRSGIGGNGSGFSPHPEHEEPEVLATLSAVQVLILLNRQDALFGGLASEIRTYLHSLMLPDGSFCNRGPITASSEGDCRFVYASLNALALLHDESIQTPADCTISWLLRCQNLDGGFGCRPDGECESHAGHTFCCLAALALCGGLDQLRPRAQARLARWLGDRQCREGGLNGRPGKAPDACYTWWTLASNEMLLMLLHRSNRTSQKDLKIQPLSLRQHFQLGSLRGFLVRCVGPGGGGIAAHPGDDPDPFHTFFGLAGSSLLQWGDGPDAKSWLRRISPVLAFPSDLVPVPVQDALAAGLVAVAI